MVTPESVYDRLAKVTPAEIQAIAQKIFQKRTLCLAMVGSGPGQEKLTGLIRSS